MKTVPFLKKAKNWFGEATRFITPSKKTIKGGAWGIIILSILIHFLGNLAYAKFIGIHNWLIFLVSIAGLAVLAGMLTHLLIRGLNKLSRLLKIALAVAISVVMFSFAVNQQTIFFMLGNLLLIAASIGASIWLVYKGYFKKTRPAYKVLIIVAAVIGFGGLIAGTWWFIHPGKAHELPVNAAYHGFHLPNHIQLDNPGRSGFYEAAGITYGSGTDKRRPEYGEDASLISGTVDGSKFLEQWDGWRGKLRTRYFGFGKDSLPLNARVWFPRGDGPFPLVLMVHGNHLAQDYSESGYDYLGTHLASRGFIFVSVDQNFINGSFTNLFKGFSGENDARGWLMLKHLELWRKWNADSTHMAFGFVDMDKIALIGHSRGGEAVAHAALFNKLPHYPDNAKETFDFNFNIRAVVAIAPVDGQYQPAGILTPLKDVNYFVMQGSHDADMQSYLGLRQLNRVTFSEGYEGFKAGLYIYGANHGQFNDSWGRKDFFSPRINFINTGQLMPAIDQKIIAKLFISAFLDASLHEKHEYKALFTDHRMAGKWMPSGIFLHQFEDASAIYICNFQEDLDLTTTTMAGGRIETEGLTVWREKQAGIKWGNQDTRAAYIGWHSHENDSLPASYTIHLSADSLADSSIIDISDKFLILSVADANEDANPAQKKKGVNTDGNNKNPITPGLKSNNHSTNTDKQAKDPKDDKKEPIDFSIELVDRYGQTIRFALSNCKYLQPALKAKMGKLSFMSTAPDTETIFDFFSFPVTDLLEENPDFDPTQLSVIRLVFDRTDNGVIMLNNLGFMGTVNGER